VSDVKGRRKGRGREEHQKYAGFVREMSEKEGKDPMQRGSVCVEEKEGEFE